MTDIMLPAVINDRPNKRMVRGFGEIKMLGIAVKIARNIHMRCTLAEAQNWKCCWCGTYCIPEPGHSNSATIEHVTPRSLGGSDEWEKPGNGLCSLQPSSWRAQHRRLHERCHAPCQEEGQESRGRASHC
jgi:hypothetical protein